MTFQASISIRIHNEKPRIYSKYFKKSYLIWNTFKKPPLYEQFNE